MNTLYSHASIDDTQDCSSLGRRVIESGGSARGWGVRVWTREREAEEHMNVKHSAAKIEQIGGCNSGF